MSNVILLCGGKSAEHDISLLSASSVVRNLNPDSYSVSVLGIRRDGTSYHGDEIRQLIDLEDMAGVSFPEVEHWLTYLQHQDRDGSVVFPVLHGPHGEDGTIQGALEVLDLAYVGAGTGGSAVGMNKLFCKGILHAANLPVLPWTALSRREWISGSEVVTEKILEDLGLPLFVKPANMGSSIGINRVGAAAQISTAVEEALEFDEYVLVERAIDAREIEISVLGSSDPTVSVPGEIVPEDLFYSYEAKYLKEGSQLLIPAPITGEQIAQIQELAVAAYKSLQLEGMARVDFLLQKDTGDLWINEPNTIPGFTKISMYPKLWEASGVPYSALLDKLIQLGIERRRRRAGLRLER